MMYKKLVGLVLGVMLIFNVSAQNCTGTESFTLNPVPPTGGYTPGTIVNVCYTMDGWTEVSSNWLEGFDINLGPGWTNLTPGLSPVDCFVASSGQWLWMLNTTSSTTGITVGPGWFYEFGSPGNGNPGDDFGDWDPNGTCSWSFCFTVEVIQTCNPLDLTIQVTAGGDGTWGGWTNNACVPVPFNIYNGNIQVVIPTTSNINHY